MSERAERGRSVQKIVQPTTMKERMMKLMSVIAAAVLLSAGTAGASAPEFRFAGEVKAGQLPTGAFGLVVQAGHVQILDLPSGLKLELSAPREDSEQATTLIRLLQASGQDAMGQQYRVLHEARAMGPSADDRSFSYLVCGAQVTFYTPAPTTTPTCKQ